MPAKHDDLAPAWAKNRKQNDEENDNLYWKVYAAGVVFVFVSLTFQGCLFYSCQAGVSNFGTSLSAKSNPTGGKYLGTFREAWECENACLEADETFHSFTFLTIGAGKDRLDGMCYGGLSPRWEPVKLTRKHGTTAVSGRFAF